MWVLVFFDLPVLTKTERKAAASFRSFLLDDGYIMLQFSVYARACREEAAEKHIQRLMLHLPPAGSIRALQVTDKQYARTKILIGTKTESENQASKQLLLL